MRQYFPKRKRIFVGAEGESERSLAKWLKRLCDKSGLRVHLDIRVCGGGDSLEVVTFSVKQYRKRSKQYGKFSSGMILLDDDRIEEDKRNDRDPYSGLANENLSLVRLVPNLEGFLLRLHPGFENAAIPRQSAKRDLQRQWPEYRKSISAQSLDRHFQLQQLQRTARTDANIQQVLEILGLPLK